jgi:hypothetical protein
MPSPGADDSARYSFHRIGEGFVRLDSRTGQVSQCGWSASGWSCKVVPDERAALDSAIARLQFENAALKRSILSKGLELPADVTAVPPTPQARAPDKPTPPASVPDTSPRPPQVPSEADLDRAITYIKNVWRKLVDMMIDLQRDIQRKS